MTMKTEAMTGGFADPVFQAQDVFRMLMDAMSRPGTLQTVNPDVVPPKPLGVAAGAIALCLCDPETPVWFGQGLAKSAAVDWISFHAGAPVASEKSECRFAFLEAGAPLPSFSLFPAGTQEYPDRSTTIIFEVTGLEGGNPLSLSGPGIRAQVPFAPRGLPETFLRQWTDNRALFPRGVDLILTSGRQFVALPRTCKITRVEG